MILCACSLLNADATENNLVFHASFFKSEKPEVFAPGSSVQWHGSARLIPGSGIHEGTAAMYTDVNGFGVLPSSLLNIPQGSISFWMFPVGDFTGGSHTYLSWSWKGDKPGAIYGTLSQGWWEDSGGGGSTYFIFNNEVGGCGDATDLTPGMWTHYAITWDSAGKDNVALKFYRNGKVLANRITRKPLPAGASLDPAFYLGTDKASNLSKGRFADIRMNELRIYSRVLTDAEVQSLFLSHAPENVIEQMKNPFSWMKDVDGKLPRERRDDSGRLLESRILFAEGNVLHYLPKAELIQNLERIRDAGFNVYSPIVWHGNGRDYGEGSVAASRRLEKFEKLNPDYDGYATLVEEAHSRGMEVHSVFAVMQATHNLAKNVFPTWPEKVVEGTRFYNGYDPEFRTRIVEVIMDHLRNYPVDGLTLDFIRLQGGLDTEAARKEYHSRYGRELEKDITDDGRMKAFTRDCLNDLVRTIATDARKIRPGLVISACDKVRPAGEGLAGNGRNTAEWLKQGWIDVVVNMDYGQRLGIERLDAVRKESQMPWAYVEGLGNYDWNGSQCVPRESGLFTKLVDYCRRKYNDGNGLFVYFSTYLSDEQVKALRSGPFRELAIPSWKGESIRRIEADHPVARFH